MTKKIVITGAHGSVGKDVVDFLSADFNPVPLSHKTPLRANVFRGAIGVIHLAALTPMAAHSIEEYLSANVEFTKHILNQCVQCKIPRVMIPTSWSWSFRIGYYQYSKLLQEKVAREFINNGLDVVLLELPEVITTGYTGILRALTDKVMHGETTTVADMNIKIIHSKDLAKAFIAYLTHNSRATNIYARSVKTINLYQYVRDQVEKLSPENLKSLSKGPQKIRAIEVKSGKLFFPVLEYDKTWPLQ